MGLAVAKESSIDRALSPYALALRGLSQSGAPFMVGGTHAFASYTQISRPTKDLDLFVTRENRDQLLEALRALGWSTQVAFPHWLSKAQRGTCSIDIIHGAGNGIAMVDDEWFAHARRGKILGMEVLLTPLEEMIWSKAFVMEKYRFDGADVAHLLLRQGHTLDWDRLLRRFGRHWRVLFAHLVLFQFIYPGRRAVPPAILTALAARVARGEASSEAAVCQGVFLSRKQYRVDTESWGLRDARLDPDIAMTPGDIVDWTVATPGPRGPDA